MSEARANRTWHDLGPRKGMTFDPGHVVWLGNRRVAVFPLGPGYTAIDDLCPHAGASLGDGWRDGNVIVSLRVLREAVRRRACPSTHRSRPPT